MTDSFDNEQKSLTANVKAGGCAAKIGARELSNMLAKVPVVSDPNLLAGIGNFEDAAVYRLSPDQAIIQTIDFFPPLVDDPYLFGQIAATNALSDVYAMGGKPIIALNVVCFPTCDYPEDVLTQILLGGAAQVSASGAILAGGHSIQIEVPVYGLAVTGLVNPQEMLTNGGAKPGDRLVLTKPIGTGVALLGMKGDMLSSDAKDELLTSLITLNDKALNASRGCRINALTDVTGFGLIGHLHEMAKASKLAVALDAKQVPLLAETLDLASQGFVPAGAYGNRQSFTEFVSYISSIPLELEDLFFDPQTSGGLLFSVSAEDADRLVANLKKVHINGHVIGRFFAADEKAPGSVEITFSD